MWFFETNLPTVFQVFFFKYFYCKMLGPRSLVVKIFVKKLGKEMEYLENTKTQEKLDKQIR